ncbi:MAG: sigma-70 domain-containing protein [Gemmatimonadaceae bacterium]|nr:sigma-70 domain-containing protein [Gemmatimonadaceae bacterium]
MVDKIARMRRIALRLQEELGREPSDDELAGELGIPVYRVSQMRTASIRPVPLDAPIGDDDSNNYSEIVQDENASTPYEDLEEQTVTAMLRELIKTLDQREATILSFRFGLDGGANALPRRGGARSSELSERVRQIQNIALRKLRKMIEKIEAKQR